MEILYGKSKLKEYMLEQINDLFVMNYKSYHYTNLTSLDGIQSLLVQDTFDCVCACEGEKIVGFAAFYEYSHKDCTVSEYKLAHLLVDTSCRGKGIGSILEDSRQLMINKRDGDKVIYASCVEHPKNSMYMKLYRGFMVNGFRYHYRNADDVKNNALILVNTAAVSYKHIITVATSCQLTRNIIREGNFDVIFEDIVTDKHWLSGNDNVKYSIDITSDLCLGRTVGRIYSNQASVTDLGQLSLPSAQMDDYVSVLVSLSIKGFGIIDSYLQSKYYYPVSYIPYIDNYYGELEYQYLPRGIDTILDDDNVSIEGKNFIRRIIVTRS